MKVWIVEDEPPAVRRLQQMISQIEPEAEFLPAVETVEDAVKWVNQTPRQPDLGFFDIQLADGLSLDIFRQAKVNFPVIFTTAFNEYALQAFKVNSIDYLLKPVDQEELIKAVDKYRHLYPVRPLDQMTITELVMRLTKPEYTRRFLLRSGQNFTYLNVEEIQAIYSEDSLSFTITKNLKKHILDFTLDDLEKQVDPALFFRINRRVMVHINCIEKVAPYFNNRMKVYLQLPMDLDTIVSRERVKDFKAWMGR